MIDLLGYIYKEELFPNWLKIEAIKKKIHFLYCLNLIVQVLVCLFVVIINENFLFSLMNRGLGVNNF